MQISLIRYNNYNIYNYNQNNVRRSKSFNTSEPSFCSAKSFIAKNFFHHTKQIDETKTENDKQFNLFTEKPNKVTFEEYKEIKKKTPTIFYNAQKKIDIDKKHYRFKMTPKSAASLAITLKNHFDKQYGMDKYRLISLGTSPSPVTELMNEMGCDITFLPISSIHTFHNRNCRSDDSDIDAIREFKNIDVALDYLEHKKINDGKTNILLDYTVNGATLILMRDLIKERFGFDDENFATYDILKLLRDISKDIPKCKKNAREELNQLIDCLDTDMYESTAELYSNVPHFSIYEKINKDNEGWVCAQDRSPQDIYYDFENYSKKLGRCFALIGLRELDKMGYFEKK